MRERREESSASGSSREDLKLDFSTQIVHGLGNLKLVERIRGWDLNP